MTNPLLQAIARQVTAGVNPINSPAAHDVFGVSGPRGKLYSPRCRIAECNGREVIAQEQQAPGFMGAILSIRGEHLLSVAYDFPMWEPGTFAAMDNLADVCGAAMNARPQQSLRVTDLRLRYARGGGSVDMTPVVIGHQQLVRSGEWVYRIKFTRNARLQLGGGPVAAPRTDAEVRIKAKSAQRDAANADYMNAYAAAVKAQGG